MMNIKSISAPTRAFCFSVAFACIGVLDVGAAPINYGDFFGTTVDYLQVTETTNTPGDPASMFGAPTIIGDSLDFNPSGFSASSAGGIPDITDGQLNYTLMSKLGAAITQIAIDESGDYTLFGTGTVATSVGYGLSLSSLKVFEIDGVALGSPITIPPASVSDSKNLINDPGIGTPWSLSITYDVVGALDALGVSYNLGATKVEVALDNTLIALSESGSTALVAKKDQITITTTTTVPEPSAVALLSCAGLGIGIGRRRRR